MAKQLAHSASHIVQKSGVTLDDITEAVSSIVSDKTRNSKLTPLQEILRIELKKTFACMADQFEQELLNGTSADEGKPIGLLSQNLLAKAKRIR